MRKLSGLFMVLATVTWAQDEPLTLEALPPVVIQTVPASGDAEVDPSVTELRATFSKDMTKENFSWVQMNRDAFPETVGKPKWDKDGRTCILTVKLKPNHTYVLWLNRGKFSSFMDTQGNRAVPYMLAFKTRSN